SSSRSAVGTTSSAAVASPAVAPLSAPSLPVGPLLLPSVPRPSPAPQAASNTADSHTALPRNRLQSLRRGWLRRSSRTMSRRYSMPLAGILRLGLDIAGEDRRNVAVIGDSAPRAPGG